MNANWKGFFDQNRLVKIGWVLVAVISALLSARNGGDFDVFLEAGKKLSQGENIYRPPFIGGLQYFYSVFFALVLWPFSAYPFLTEFCWLIFSWWCCYRSLHLLFDFYSSESWIAQYPLRILGWVAVLGFQVMFYNIANIQMTPFLLWAILESYRLSESKKGLWAGLLLGLAINIKIIPILILPYFLYRGFFSTLLSTVGVLFLLFWLPGLFIGFDLNKYLHQEWWLVVNPFKQQHMMETEIGPHSVVAWLPTLLMDTNGTLEGRRHIVDLPIGTTLFLVQCVRAGLVLLTLYFLRGGFRSRFARAGNLHRAWELAYVLMLIPLLMPHQQKYSFLFVFPMIIYLLNAFYTIPATGRTRAYYGLLILFVACMLVYSPIHGKDVLGKHLFEWSQHLHLLTWSTLLLIPIAMYCTPDRLYQHKEKKE